MEPKPELFDHLNSYGHHAIQVTHPREWFAKMDKIRKEGDDDHFSSIRLEAATGADQTKLIGIPKPDGLMERSYQLVKFLDKENPEGNRKQFLSRDGKACSRRLSRSVSPDLHTREMRVGRTTTAAAHGSCSDCTNLVPSWMWQNHLAATTAA